MCHIQRYYHGPVAYISSFNFSDSGYTGYSNPAFSGKKDDSHPIPLKNFGILFADLHLWSY